MNFPLTRRSLSKFSFCIRDVSIRKRYFSDEIIIKKIGLVTCIGLNRPEKKNCINPGIIKDLEEAVGKFERDDSSPVAVLYGERGNFSHGYDVKEFNENPALLEEMKHIGLLESCCTKVIIAALSGYALGPAFDLALWCDFRIIEETAALAGYARQFGMPLTERSAERLVTMVGLNKAMDLVLTGRIVKPKEALESGIATRIVACGTGLGQAVSFANSIANMPSSCLQADRISLLAASKKYSESVRKSLLQKKKMFADQAIQECKNKLHLTMTGDVRQKKCFALSGIEVQALVRNWIKRKPESFFLDGTLNTVCRRIEQRFNRRGEIRSPTRRIYTKPLVLCSLKKIHSVP